MDKLLAWVRQPTTVAGISAALGTLVAVLLGQMNLATAVPLLSGAVVSMVLPDNTGAKQQAVVLAQDIVAQVSEKQGAKS